LVTEAPRPQCPNVNINFYLCWNWLRKACNRSWVYDT
jgi:hypothetical protein